MLKKHILFPQAEQSKPFFEDILSIFEETRITPKGEYKVYSRNHSIPDDFAHALNFSVLTARLLTRDTILDSIIED